VLDAAAQRERIPTNALAALWLWESLESKAGEPGSLLAGLHAPKPYAGSGRALYPRRNSR